MSKTWPRLLIAVALPGTQPPRLAKARAYLDWLARDGVDTRIVAPECPALPEAASGLLLTGGGDVDPLLYGEEAVHVEQVSRARDELELALVGEARRRGLPLLGICRGAQLLGVALGGSLVQDIPVAAGSQPAVPHRNADPHGGDTEHVVSVEPGSRLARLLGTTRLRVNSHHHQAVRSVPSPARIVARAEDGVAEALELAGPSFVVAVQWHPERWSQPSSRALRRAFLRAAADRLQAGSSDSSSGNEVTGSRITWSARVPESK